MIDVVGIDIMKMIHEPQISGVDRYRPLSHDNLMLLKKHLGYICGFLMSSNTHTSFFTTFVKY